MVSPFAGRPAPAGLTYWTDGDAWMLAEDLPEMNFFFAQIWLRAFANRMDRSVGTNYHKILSVFRRTHQQFYYGGKDSSRFTRELFGKIEADPAFGELINANIKTYSDALVAHAKTVSDLGADGLSKLSNAQLWQSYAEHVEKHLQLYEWGWLSNATDMFDPAFTTYLKDYLRGLPGAGLSAPADVNEGLLNEHFVALTACEEETVATDETRSLLTLAIQLQNANVQDAVLASPVEFKEQLTPELSERVHAHWQRFRHLNYMYHGLPAPLEHVQAQLRELLQPGKNPSAELSALNEQVPLAKATKTELEERLGVDEKHKRLFGVFAEFMVTKWYRRNAQILSFYHLEPLLVEIGKRLNLPLALTRVLLWEEVQTALTTSNRPTDAQLQDRFEYHCFYVENGKHVLLTGEEAKALEKTATTKVVDTSVRELRGQTASLGYGKGRVRIIQRASDMVKMQQGDILVAYATDPDVVPAMKKAAAIVTDQGGVTCHAAIVSRELGIPCVIGTKVATKTLQDGELVEVDANKGIVRRLEG